MALQPGKKEGTLANKANSKIARKKTTDIHLKIAQSHCHLNFQVYGKGVRLAHAMPG